MRTNVDLDGIQLDRHAREPLYAQLAEAVRARILEGRWPENTKLPATRDLASALKLNRTTVVEAYRLLREEGWLRSGVGAGTFVRAKAPPPREAHPLGGGSFWGERLGELPRPLAERGPASFPEGTIRLTSPTADPEAFPIGEFFAALEEVFRREGSRCLDYGPSEGYGPLRELIARRLRGQGVDVDPSRVILVNGSQQGIDLLLRLLALRGRTLLVEEPTYPLVLRAARALDVSVRSVPMDGDGLRVDLLESILDTTRGGLLYTMPVFQNPTGVNLSPERRTALLALAADRGLPIVEDHFDAELDYRGDAPPPLLAEGGPAGVILLGTFSKILFPGLRIGWLVVPEVLVGPLSELKVCTDLSTGLLTQMAVHEFCARGGLDSHLVRIRERNRARLAAMLGALEKQMPAGVEWTRPNGGMACWLRLPKGIDSEVVAEEAGRRGVAVTPGPAFHVDGGGRDGMRLCFVREGEERIAEGIRKLAETIRDLSARRPARAIEGAAAPVL
jgi:DNA-binding transcriptional MocR family regulator